MPGQFRTVEGVRNLNQNPRAIAHERVRPDRPTVIQISQDVEALGHDVVGLLAFYVGHKADATGVVFIFGVV